MTAEPAEYWGRLYMAQPWGGKAKMPYRHLLAQIRSELHSPFTRCPECEEPYIPILASWPTQTANKPDRPDSRHWSRYLICPYCGHRTVLRRKVLYRTPIYSKEQRRQMLDLYSLGMTSSQIAKVMFCHPSTVCLYVREAGLTRPKGGSGTLRGISHAELELVRHLYEHRGWTQQQIGDHLGISRWSVGLRVKHGGMVRRGTTPRKQKTPPEQKVRLKA